MRLTRSQKKRLHALAGPVAGLLHRALRRLAGQPARGSIPANPQCILVVRLDTIGDVLLSEPAVALLREAYPETRIDLVCNAAGRAVLEGNPAIDEFVIYAAPWHAAWRGARVGWRRELATLWRTLRELRRRRYDLAVELRGDFRDIAFAALSGAGAVVGQSWRGGRELLDLDASVDPNAHRVEFALGIAAAARSPVPRPDAETRGRGDRRTPGHGDKETEGRGEIANVPASPRPPRLFLAAGEQARAVELLAPAEGRAVAFHLGAGFASKCLPLPKLAAVADRLAARGLQIVVIGGREDLPLVERFRALSAAEPIDLVGRLSLRETAAVIGRCALFVGNDSGPMHLAAAVGTPVVTFFGPSEPWKYHPHGVEYRLLESELPCRPCDHVHCVHREFLCLSSISVDEIVRAAEELLVTLSNPRPEGRG